MCLCSYVDVIMAQYDVVVLLNGLLYLSIIKYGFYSNSSYNSELIVETQWDTVPMHKTVYSPMGRYLKPFQCSSNVINSLQRKNLTDFFFFFFCKVCIWSK